MVVSNTPGSLLQAISLLWIVYIVGNHVVDDKLFIYMDVWPLNLCFVQVEDQRRDDEECSEV